jgi:TolA-binding protein
MEAEFPDHESPIALDGKTADTLKPVAPLASAPPSARAASAAVVEPATPPPATVTPPAPDGLAADVTIRIVQDGRTAAPALAVTAGPPSTVATSDPAAKQELDRGVAFFRAHDFDRAISTLSAFLARSPDHAGAESALHALGASYLARGEALQAADAFGGMLARFPHGAMVPESLLGLGECAVRLGRDDKAQAYFDRLALEFPKSDAARRIPKDRAARVSRQP